jgi:hypothetical protein
MTLDSLIGDYQQARGIYASAFMEKVSSSKSVYAVYTSEGMMHTYQIEQYQHITI